MENSKLEPLSPVVTEQLAKEIAGRFGTPIFAYSQRLLEGSADEALAFPNAYGLIVRYAMKANPNINLLRIFDRKGIHIDASSIYEVERAIKAGIKSERILLTAQEFPTEFQMNKLSALGFGREGYNCCSLNQLEQFGKIFPYSDVSIRLNPGLGSGGTNKTNTGGPGSSFGVWHEEIWKIINVCEKYSLNVVRIHTHIGSGSDPKIWKKTALMHLENLNRFLERGHKVGISNQGGGYKIGRMSHEKSTDLQKCGEPIKKAFMDFANQTRKELKLEIEPGTFLVANAGCLVVKIIDLKLTSDYNFLIIDSGMTEITRPILYGAQHPIAVIPMDNTQRGIKEYIVSGHCCESGDILTPLENNPEELSPRRLLEAKVGDLLVIGGAGAYCASMTLKNYNSYPEAAEVLIGSSGKLNLIRNRQVLAQITQNEIPIIN